MTAWFLHLVSFVSLTAASNGLPTIKVVCSANASSGNLAVKILPHAVGKSAVFVLAHRYKKNLPDVSATLATTIVEKTDCNLINSYCTPYTIDWTISSNPPPIIGERRSIVVCTRAVSGFSTLKVLVT